jgi:hypothetical protein
MDRSIKGVRLCVARDVPVGAVINVRVSHLNPPMPWLEVKVCNTKRSGANVELGCEFVSSPTWNVMLLFG